MPVLADLLADLPAPCQADDFEVMTRPFRIRAAGHRTGTAIGLQRKAVYAVLRPRR